MDATGLIDALERFAAVLPAVVRPLGPEDARWKPAGGAWSVLEIVTHLADEETEDFRRRLELTLRDAAAPWPPNDPERWAVERRYNEGHLDEVLARFTSERTASIAWLRGLNQPRWDNTYRHPQAGPIRAGDLLASWAAHDMLHLRQIAKRMFQLAQRDGGEYQTDYAGEWKA